jgi:hypothetical protein
VAPLSGSLFISHRSVDAKRKGITGNSGNRQHGNAFSQAHGFQKSPPGGCHCRPTKASTTFARRNPFSKASGKTDEKELIVTEAILTNKAPSTYSHHLFDIFSPAGIFRADYPISSVQKASGITIQNT